MEQQVTLERKNFGFGKLGNCLCLWAKGEIFLTVGPDWIFNICMLTVMLIVLCMYLIFLAPSIVSASWQVIGLSIILANILFYSLTAFSNPGIVLVESQGAQEAGGQKGKFKCKFCQVYQGKDTEHCLDCGLCVQELDHHCPISGKCIAKGNLIYFYAFLVSVMLFFVEAVVWASLSFHPRRNLHQQFRCNDIKFMELLTFLPFLIKDFSGLV